MLHQTGILWNSKGYKSLFIIHNTTNRDKKTCYNAGICTYKYYKEVVAG